MATFQQIEAFTAGRLGDGVVYLPAFDLAQYEAFRNKGGSGPMLDEDFEIWWNLMQKDHEDRDRARRHKGGWNAKAIAALCELSPDDVRETWATCHEAFREEWLNDHGVGLILRKVTSGFEWLNGIAVAICTAVGGWAYIGSVIGTVLAPVIRKEVEAQEKEEAGLEIQEGAMAWFLDRALPLPADSSTWPGLAAFLQQQEDSQGWGRDLELAYLQAQGLVSSSDSPAPAAGSSSSSTSPSGSSSPQAVASTGGDTFAPATASGGAGLAVAAGVGLLLLLLWT